MGDEQTKAIVDELTRAALGIPKNEPVDFVKEVTDIENKTSPWTASQRARITEMKRELVGDSVEEWDLFKRAYQKLNQ